MSHQQLLLIDVVHSPCVCYPAGLFMFIHVRVKSLSMDVGWGDELSDLVDRNLFCGYSRRSQMDRDAVISRLAHLDFDVTLYDVTKLDDVDVALAADEHQGAI